MAHRRSNKSSTAGMTNISPLPPDFWKGEAGQSGTTSSQLSRAISSPVPGPNPLVTHAVLVTNIQRSQPWLAPSKRQATDHTSPLSFQRGLIVALAQLA